VQCVEPGDHDLDDDLPGLVALREVTATVKVMLIDRLCAG
jgi:hypothetical protein